jgi:YHS domain-containing protein
MTVDRNAGGPTSERLGRTYYFCSDHCRHTFDANPEAHV